MTPKAGLSNCLLLLLALNSCCWTALGVEKIRQCFCDEQFECFENFKDESAECVDECVDRAGMETVFSESSPMGQCMHQRKQLIRNFFDCLNHQITPKQSCIFDTDKAQVPYRDFESALIKFGRPIIQQNLQQLEGIYSGQNIPFIRTALDIERCSRDCGLKKLQNLQCFNKKRCALNIDDEQERKLMLECVAQTNLKQRYYEICECFHSGGEKEVAAFCQKIQMTEFGT